VNKRATDVGFPWHAVVGRCVDWTALRWAAGAVPIDTGGYNMVCGCESGVGETVWRGKARIYM
jgi:hypothetical protein